MISCDQEGRTVIGADGFLELPIWSLTAEVSQKLLSGEPLKAVMDWMDKQGITEGGTP